MSASPSNRFPFIPIYDTQDTAAQAQSLRGRCTLANLTHGSSMLMLYVQCSFRLHRDCFKSHVVD